VKKSLITILIPAVILIIIAYAAGGFDLVAEGFAISMKTALRSALMLLVSFVLIGQIQVLVTKETINRLLEKFSGLKGIVIGSIAGGLFPGGPYIYYPFIQSFNKKGMPFYILLAFISGKSVYDFSRIPMEVSMISPGIALVRNLITFPVPILIGLIAKRFYKARTTEDIFMKSGDMDD